MSFFKRYFLKIKYYVYSCSISYIFKVDRVGAEIDRIERNLRVSFNLNSFNLNKYLCLERNDHLI